MPILNKHTKKVKQTYSTNITNNFSHQTFNHTDSENLKFGEPFPNEIKSESIGVQCSISIDDNLKLKTPRDHDIE